MPVKIGIIGGSGLDDPNLFKDAVKKSVETPYGTPSSALLEGTIEGVKCVFISRHGVKHNISPTNVNYRANVWALKEAGCTHILASSACGSLQEEIAPGDIVIPDSFIDLTKHRISTFYNNDGPKPQCVLHIPMEPSFCNETRQVVLDVAEKLDIKCRNGGTSVVIEGPRFSSLAESRLYRTWGAHLVNMTLVPEVILAKEAGLCYACIAMATDYDCWNENEAAVSVEKVIKIFKENVEKVKQIIQHSVKEIATKNWDETIANLKRVVENSVQSKE